MKTEYLVAGLIVTCTIIIFLLSTSVLVQQGQIKISMIKLSELIDYLNTENYNRMNDLEFRIKELREDCGENSKNISTQKERAVRIQKEIENSLLRVYSSVSEMEIKMKGK